MCKWLSDNGFNNTPLHFSRFYPTYKLEQLPPTPAEVLKNAVKIASAEGLKYVYTGNVPGDEVSDTKCPLCGNLVVARQGFTVTANNLKDGKCNKCGHEISGIWN
jgi:pyruvate formate lyase activating enzyme